MRFAILGSNGLLGSDLLLEFREKDHEVRGFTKADFDASTAKVSELCRLLDKFDVVINAAAYTNVSEAEKYPSEAFSVNAEFPKKLAQACRDIGSKIAHISTDYVFKGDAGEPYSTSSATDPINVYGASKALGEMHVQDAGAIFTIFRTSWLYGANGNCFPQSIIAQLNKVGEARVVKDQYGQPTWTRDVALFMLNYLENQVEAPIVHASASGAASWFQFALEIADSKGFGKSQIIPIESAALSGDIPRPAYSVLNVDNQIKSIGEWKQRWRQAAPLFSN